MKLITYVIVFILFFRQVLFILKNIFLFCFNFLKLEIFRKQFLFLIVDNFLMTLLKNCFNSPLLLIPYFSTL